MSTRTRLDHVSECVWLTLAGCLLVAGVPVNVVGQEDAKKDEPVSQEQMARIESATTPDRLKDLAKQFVFQRKYPAARMCIEQICTKQPELLTDSERQSPKRWNEFWFGHRAALRERKLAKDDAAGRVELAIWLHEAGVISRAQEMLKAALEIDKKFPQARQLAEQWHLFGGGPVQFDLRYGLVEPLLMDSVKDENEEVVVRKDRMFLLVPFAYDPGDDKLVINKAYLKVRSDEGRSCMVKGIALLEGGPSPSGLGRIGSRSGPAQLRKQGDSEPLLERLQIERAPDGDQYEVTCFNTAHPMVRRVPAERRAGRRGGFSAGRDSARSDGPATRPGSGFAAFVVELPRSAKFVDCRYHDGSSMRLHMEWLKVLASPASEFSGPAGDQQMDLLLAQATAPERPIAGAVVWKLAEIRSPASRGQRSRDESLVPDAATSRIDRALLTAMGHPDRQVQQEAFQVMVLVDTPLGKACLEMIETCKVPDVLLAMLNQIEAFLASPPAEQESPRAAGRSSRVEHALEELEPAVAALPSSPGAANVFAALSACLRSGHASVRQRGLDIVLTDGTQQSVKTVADAATETKEALIGRLSEVEDDELKAAILRVLILRSDAPTMSKLFAACDKLVLTIGSEQDPLLTELMGRHPGQVLQKLLELLARADLRAVVGSEKLSKTLDGLAMEHTQDPAVRSAILKLGLEMVKQLPYQAPVQHAQKQGAKEPEASGIEPLLARLATDPDAKVETSREAAAALVRAGRLTALKEQFQRTSDSARCRDIVRFVGQDKSLWERGALPGFLASCLSHRDATTVQLALAPLAEIYRAADPQQRWRVNLAVKQDLDLKRLVNLTLHDEDRISRQAMALLQEVAMMSSAESQELQLISGEAARLDRLSVMVRERVSRPGGRFACMVYLDVKPAGASPDSRRGPTVRQTGAGRCNVPLASSVVAIQRTGASRFQVIADGKEIGISSEERGRGGRGRGSGENTLSINAAILLRAALTSADAEKEGLAGEVDLSPLSEQQDCRLEPDQLGTWSGEVTGIDQQAGGGRPLCIAGARIFLEPLRP